MDWTTLAATAGGAIIAFTGTVLADRLRHRHEKDRSRDARARDLYVQFITSAGTCHTRLRQLAQDPGACSDLEADTRAAFVEAGIYEVRERLFIDATARVAAAGQIMFERLRALRRVVAGGASWSSGAFHDIYHPYIDAVWNYRAAVREELGSSPLSPSVFGWDSLNGLATCPVCRSPIEGAHIPPPRTTAPKSIS